MPINDYIARWTMDDTSGTTCVDSTGSYNGTYVNSPTLQETGAFGSSKAVTFASASSEKVTATNPIAAYPFTVALWAKPTDLAAQRDVFTLRTALGVYRIESRVDGTCRVVRYDGTTNDYSITKASAFSPGVFSHACVVYASASDCKLFINAGTPVAGAVSVNYASPTALDMAYGVAYFNGTIDDVRIYSRALSAGEVLELFLSHPINVRSGVTVSGGLGLGLSLAV